MIEATAADPSGDQGGGYGADGEIVEPANRVLAPTIGGLPDGYVYGVTRYADVILQGILPDRLAELIHALDAFRPTLDELRAGGGGRTVFVARFDQSLADQVDQQTGEPVWGKKKVVIYRGAAFEGEPHPLVTTRGHEIDMFGVKSVAPSDRLPGVAVEMEWNNKDPFYDRDLVNFDALHREGAIVVGVIVTRGPGLQALISQTIMSKDGGFKYGQSSTHWDKLTPRVNLGGGGECPLLLIGIEPERIEGIAAAHEVLDVYRSADEAIDPETWRDRFDTYAEARAERRRLRDLGREMLPPLTTDTAQDEAAPFAQPGE